MKALKPLIALAGLVTIFFFGQFALADGPSDPGYLTVESAPAAPKLTVAIDGTKASLSWNKVAGATGYKIYYAQYPYDNNPDSIKAAAVGDETGISFELLPGNAYIAAVTACKDEGTSCSAASNIQNVIIPLPTLRNSLGQEFKLIPAGRFTMGSPQNESGRKVDETPHPVTLTQPFYMQTTEVTQGQWHAVMENDPSHSFDCLACPMDMVSWDDVQLFIAGMNSRGEGIYSLPTEAQWEYAARAGAVTAFASGGITDTWCNEDPNLDAIGWYCYNSNSQIHEVGRKSPNAWGLYDMSGNLGEWCEDWYGTYPSTAVTDPQGPSSGSSRVVRGGGWDFYARYCRSASRGYYSPATRYNFTGFRLLRQPE